MYFTYLNNEPSRFFYIFELFCIQSTNHDSKMTLTAANRKLYTHKTRTSINKISYSYQEYIILIITPSSWISIKLNLLMNNAVIAHLEQYPWTIFNTKIQKKKLGFKHCKIATFHATSREHNPFAAAFPLALPAISNFTSGLCVGAREKVPSGFVLPPLCPRFFGDGHNGDCCPLSAREAILIETEGEPRRWLPIPHGKQFGIPHRNQ